jgi:hypothetical protein
MGPLPELIVSGFDEEQLWEQIQLRQRPLIRFLERQSRALLAEMRSHTKSMGAHAKDTHLIDESLGECVPQTHERYHELNSCWKSPLCF